MTAFWLEISVEADSEAVEAVSEILGRVAPTGTSVEPGFCHNVLPLAASQAVTMPVIPML